MFRFSVCVTAFLYVSCGGAAAVAPAPAVPARQPSVSAPAPEQSEPLAALEIEAPAPPTDGAEASGLTEETLMERIPGGITLWDGGRRAEQPTAVTVLEACYELSCETTCMVRLLIPVEVWCREHP